MTAKGTRKVLTTAETEGLRQRVQTLAALHKVLSVPSYKTCSQRLSSLKFTTGDAEFTTLRQALTHFRLLRAAIEEKTTRGKA